MPQAILLFGKFLRINVDVRGPSTPYSIPGGNMFPGGNNGRPEIYAMGLRNPWRWSFDRATGELWVADVGQDRYEEVDKVELGKNYGWNIREAAHCYNATTCATAGLVDPLAEYPHTAGNCITGGYVYRGTALPANFRGRYFFADFVAGRIWSLGLVVDSATGEARAGDLIEHTSELGSPGNISSFGVDADGEIYLVAYTSGRILKIIGPAAPPATPTGLRIVR